MSPNKAAFIYSDKLSQHILSTSHPMQPKRLAMTYDLLKQYNACLLYTSDAADE